jgi:peptidoglycan-associated lipoprotein
MKTKHILPLLLFFVLLGTGCASDPTVSLFIRDNADAGSPRQKSMEITIGDSAVIGWDAKNAEQLSISNLFSTRSIEDASLDSSDISPRPALPGPKTQKYEYIATASKEEKIARDTVTLTVVVPAPPVVNFSISKEKINASRPEDVTLSWDVSGAFEDQINITGIGKVAPKGQQMVRPKESQQYALSAVGKGGTTSKSLTLIVEVPELENVLFAYDRADIDGAAREQFNRNLDSIQTLLKDPKVRIIMEGHCDVRGGASYNYRLGYKRANNTWNYLSENLDMQDNYRRFKLISFGKAKANYKPRVPDVYPSNDSQYQADRNVNFVPTKSGKRLDNNRWYSRSQGSSYRTAPKNSRFMQHK